MEEADLAAASSGRELQPREGVDRRPVGITKLAHVTDDLIGVRFFQQAPSAFAQRRYLRRDDPPGDGQDDRGSPSVVLFF